jgi:hypothetical protein
VSGTCAKITRHFIFGNNLFQGESKNKTDLLVLVTTFFSVGECVKLDFTFNEAVLEHLENFNVLLSKPRNKFRLRLRGMKRNARRTKEVFTSFHKNNVIFYGWRLPNFCVPFCSGQLEEQSW